MGYVNALHQALAALGQRDFLSLATWAALLTAAGVACHWRDVASLTKHPVDKAIETLQLNDYDTMTGKDTRSRPTPCDSPPTSAKTALDAHLCDRKPSDNAPGEAFRTLDDAYDPTGLPERHGRVRGHVREV